MLKAAWLVLLLGAGACRPAAAPATPVSKTGPIVASTAGGGVVDAHLLFRAEPPTKLLGKVQSYLEEQDLVSTLESNGDSSKLLVPYNDEALGSSWTMQLTIVNSGGSERAVQVRVQGGFFIDRSVDEARVLYLLNEQHKQSWGGTFALDDDGEVLGRWALNMPSSVGLPASYVHDVIVRIGMGWQELRAAMLGAGIENVRDDA